MFPSFRFPLICGTAIILTGLAGCGQKGPLFMPIKQPGTASAPMAPAPAQPTMPSAPTTDVPTGAALPPPR